MLETMATWAFWLAAAFLVYAYALFPALVAAVGLWRRREVARSPCTPSVSLIIAAFNEEANIAARLDNALALDYPADQLEIIVASDGSTDATEAIVSGFAERGVRLLPLPRRGKIHALNAAVAAARGDLLVFSDANTMCDPQAIRALASNFADPAVGGVAGHTSYSLESAGESSGEGERLYWTYDTWLKELESQTGSVVSAHGGLHAVRRSLYQPVSDGGVTDDFAISTAVVEQGYRLVFDRSARASELAVPETRREFRRRVRLMTRGLRGVVMRRRLLNPFRFGFYAVLLASHKIARRLAPLGVIVLTAATFILAPRGGVYLALAAALVVFGLLAAAGYVLRRTASGRRPWLCIPFYYCMANTACLVALVGLVRGTRIELWQPQRQH
jgi:cellulose synthase/poly-beta-1,6-N-acetylglucosamine synthase-like glycosyltransferase